MYCNFILNDCKLDFKQDNITNSDWRVRMILSILSVKPMNDKEKNNDDEVTLSAIKMKWNNKQKNIARAPACRGSGGKNVIFSNGPNSTSEYSKLLY
jgi:hypothetical protein